MSYRLSLLARTDFKQIIDYIDRDSPPSAARMMDRPAERFELLDAQPLLGARLDRFQNLRCSVMGMYAIIYEPVSDGVEIVRILHGNRDIESIMQKP